MGSYFIGYMLVGSFDLIGVATAVGGAVVDIVGCVFIDVMAVGFVAVVAVALFGAVLVVLRLFDCCVVVAAEVVV